MYLFIHAAERENAFLMLVWSRKEFLKNKEVQQGKELLTFLTFDDVITFTKKLTQRKKKSPDILHGIDDLFGQFRYTPADLNGICVLSGPGQFSFLRTAVVTVNTFGWALDIPIVGISGAGLLESEFVKKGLKKLARTTRFRPIVPEYGKEPNITITKRKV